MIPVRDCSAQATKSWVSNGTGTLSWIPRGARMHDRVSAYKSQDVLYDTQIHRVHAHS
jgi:hypothetical protein